MENTQYDFLRSSDFMKLGQALNHRNWQIAMLTLQRMQREAKEAGLEIFERQFGNLRQCIISRQDKQAKDILALVTAKRAQLLRQGAPNAGEGKEE